MVEFPCKRIFGLVGPPRAGKDVVANFLVETRDFKKLAFADRIKTEFGISKEDFEAAKIAGNIEELRTRLWDFSAKKKAEDPEYFIRLVMEEAVKSEESVVITDIRTEDEFNALFKYSPAEIITRVYAVFPVSGEVFRNKTMLGSKLTADWYFEAFESDTIRLLENYTSEGLYAFHKRLDKYFFTEDIMDLPESQDDYYHKRIDNKQWRSMVSHYVSQFEVRQR